MKKSIFISLLFLLITSTGFAQWGGGNNSSGFSSKSSKDIKWDKKTHDFGVIKQHHPKTAAFTITNTSSRPVVITNAVGSCGCTEIDYPQKPIPPGKTAKVSTIFDAETLGSFNKTITVFLNIEDSRQVLRVVGIVEK